MTENRKNTPDARHLAATKIQAGFRGYRTRKACKEKCPHSQEFAPQPLCRQTENISSRQMNPHTAATRIQATFRGYETRKHLDHRGHHKAVEHPDHGQPGSITDSGCADRLQNVDLAATKIQAGFRGYRVRKAHGHPPHEEHSEKQTHAPSAETKYDPDSAATRIQASYRGYKTRKAFEGDHLPHPSKNAGALYPSERVASTKYKHRDDTTLPPTRAGAEKEVDQAATVIQAGVRGYLTRKKYGHNVMVDPQILTPNTNYSRSSYNTTDKENDPERAATKIQATYRGYRTRKHVGHPAHEPRPDAPLL